MQKTIYLAEDEPDLQLLLTANLLKEGFNVTSFNDGSEILKLTDFPDLFILDISLPLVSGLEICQWVKASNLTNHIPVILLSAEPGLQLIAENACADDFLEKPFQMAVLIEKINACLSMGENRNFDLNKTAA